MSTTHLVNAAAGRDRVPAVPSEGGHAVAGPVESLLRVTSIIGNWEDGTRNPSKLTCR